MDAYVSTAVALPRPSQKSQGNSWRYPWVGYARSRRRAGGLAARYWPLRILLLAWLTATLPVTSIQTFVEWLGQAHRFAHHLRLEMQVVELVSNGAPEAKKIASMPARPARSVPMAAETAAKKFELVMAAEHRAIAPCAQSHFERPLGWRMPAGEEKDVPYPPPRYVQAG